MSPADDSSTSAQCTNVPACRTATSGTELDWYPGPGEFCPECGLALTPPDRPSPRLVERNGKALSGVVAGPLQRLGRTGNPAVRRRIVRAIACTPAAPGATRHISTIPFAQSMPLPVKAAPPEQAARPRRSPAAMPIVLFFTAVVSVVGGSMLRPRIVGIVVPRNAAPDTAISVVYRATGLGTAGYTVLAPDGKSVIHGSLALGTGTFVLTLPKAAVTQTYLLRLRASNIVASATADHYIRVPVRPLLPAPGPLPSAVHNVALAPEPPEIRSLALDRATLAGGDTLGVYYDVSATAGTVALFDPASQITYEKAAISMSGHTTFTVPRVDIPHSLTVVLTAQRGVSTTQSRVGVNVTPADAADAGDSATDRAAGDAGLPTAISAPRIVHSREPIRVDVRGAGADVHVVLLDNRGIEAARHDVRIGQSRADFSAPDVAAPTRYTFQATFADGAGSQTLVREITVTP